MFRSILILAAGAAIGAALLIAHRVSQETGKSMSESFADVPEEARRLFDEVKDRAESAVERGRQAYQQKQAEMDEYLGGADTSV
jgi:gas vesicle protein